MKVYRASDVSKGGNQEQHPILTYAAPLPEILEGTLIDTREPCSVVQSCNWQGHSLGWLGVTFNRQTGKAEGFIAEFDAIEFTGRVVPMGGELAYAGGVGGTDRNPSKR